MPGNQRQLKQSYAQAYEGAQPAIALSAHAGVTVIGEVNQLTTHVMNVLWLLGTFTFAIVIGIIGEDVTNTIMVSFISCMAPTWLPLTWVSMSAGCTDWDYECWMCDVMSCQMHCIQRRMSAFQ